MKVSQSLSVTINENNSKIAFLIISGKNSFYLCFMSKK